MEKDLLDTDNRNKTIVRYNVVSILINIFLSAAKIIVGVVTRAHAVILDGVEDLSDLISAIFTIFSVRVGEKRADKEHPFGYGRAEYLASLFVTIIIMLVGIRSIVESVKDIIDPHDPPDYNAVLILIMVISLILKLIFGFMLRKKGRQINSTAMVMSGTDTMCDALTSASILAAILIKKIFEFDIEHYLCIGISLLIIYTGIQMMRECVGKILGTPVDPAFKKKIKNMVLTEDSVCDVQTLVIHNYGENVYIGSVDIAVDENMRAGEITKLSRRITENADKLGLTLTAVGITGANTNSPEADRIWDAILDTVRAHKEIKKAHSFRADFQEKQIFFTIVPDIEDPDKEEHLKKLSDEIQKQFPDMTVSIQTVKEI